MATAQQLEKLHQIQRLFYVEDSLESAVAGERVSQLISRTEQLLRQRAFLRDERRRLRISSDCIDERKRALAFMQRPDWLPEDLLIPKCVDNPEGGAAGSSDGAESKNGLRAKDTTPPPHVLINIGGLMFEAPTTVLMRDPGSLLAQLCGASPPIQPDPDGHFFYFDRDWWLFRYVVTFLRDGTLPDDRNLLAKLYREAAFWHLTEMQKAIEEEKLHLRSEQADNPGAPADNPVWWHKLPSWWTAVDAAQEKEAKSKADQQAASDASQDWWTSTTYNGKSFLPLSSDPEKTVTDAGEVDAKPVSTSTWTRPPPPAQYPYL